MCIRICGVVVRFGHDEDSALQLSTVQPQLARHIEAEQTCQVNIAICS